jgi:hypothetical protein
MRYVGALITLDPVFLAEWRREHGKKPFADVSHDVDLVATIQQAVDDSPSKSTRPANAPGRPPPGMAAPRHQNYLHVHAVTAD